MEEAGLLRVRAMLSDEVSGGTSRAGVMDLVIKDYQ